MAMIQQLCPQGLQALMASVCLLAAECSDVRASFILSLDTLPQRAVTTLSEEDTKEPDQG